MFNAMLYAAPMLYGKKIPTKKDLEDYKKFKKKTPYIILVSLFLTAFIIKALWGDFLFVVSENNTLSIVFLLANYAIFSTLTYGLLFFGLILLERVKKKGK